MIIVFSIVFLTLLIMLIFYINHKRKQTNKKTNLVTRFRKKFKSDSRHREKLVEKVADILMADPESNIQIGMWDREDELREKADIHRARLTKYGHSKMNGEKFFMEKKGNVYKYNTEGKKEYV